MQEIKTRNTAETIEASELGRGKYADSPSGHLAHLLNIGWKTESPLIRKYVAKHNLQELLLQWSDGNVGQ
jgi:hypothetical protein